MAENRNSITSLPAQSIEIYLELSSQRIMEEKTDRIKRVKDRVEKDLTEAGIPFGNVRVIKESARMSSSWGNVQTKRDKSGNPYFEIHLRSLLLDPNVPETALYKVMAHEYIHTAAGAMNHGQVWKHWVGVFNRKHKIDLSRTTSAKKLGIDEQLLQTDKARHGQMFPRKSAFKYYLECQVCGHLYGYQRMCRAVQHPENYHCRCGGRLNLVTPVSK